MDDDEEGSILDALWQQSLGVGKVAVDADLLRAMIGRIRHENERRAEQRGKLLRMPAASDPTGPD